MVIVWRSRAGTTRRSRRLRTALGDLDADLAVIEADGTDEDSFGDALAEFHSQLGRFRARIARRRLRYGDVARRRRVAGRTCPCRLRAAIVWIA